MPNERIFQEGSDAASSKGFDRYSYVNNNPINFNDPSGHGPCDGIYRPDSCDVQDWNDSSSTNDTSNGQSGMDGNGGSSTSSFPVFDWYVQGWKNAGTAWSIFNDPDAGPGGWAVSGGYLLFWVGAHGALAVGIGGLACAASGPACVTAVEGALGIGSAAIGVGQASTELAPYYPPNAGFSSEATELLLREGDIIARRGGSGGRYFAPQGLPVGQLSLPPVSQNLTENLFIVQKPFTVYSGTVAPWFNQIGGGIQYYSPIMNQAYLEKNLFIISIP